MDSNYSMSYFQDQLFENTDFTQTPLALGEYENCIFKNCHFAQCDLSKQIFQDCQWLGCNLSMAKLYRCTLSESLFKDCKMLGLHFDTCNPYGLSFSFEGCQLNHSSFYQVQAPKTRFKNCQLIEVDFIQSDFRDALFEHCDLSGSTFDGTILEKADFRTAFNFSIHPEKNRLKKARFSTQGLAGLLDHYDLKID